MELKLKDFALSFSETEKQARRLSDMKGYFADREAAGRMIKAGDPVVYEVYAKESAEHGGLSYAVTVINPGDVAGECFMTKGHFHEKPLAEVYLGLEGEGVIVLQDRKGLSGKVPIAPGRLSYVPGGSAHRSVNTGKSKLKFLAIYSSDSGHDYATIERSGFKERVYTK